MPFRGLSLDLRLGVRMLAKHPGLTFVGCLAMAFAICVSTSFFELWKQVVRPELPLPGGDRVVAIVTWDRAANGQEHRVLRDFQDWREQLASVRELGAYRVLDTNLIIGGGAGEPLEAVATTTSAFRVAPVPPLLGRTLVPEDERPDAPPVLVIGHQLWRSRFDSDPGVVGREVRLGGVVHTVVGVMPEGFRFPVHHDLWAPLRVRAGAYERREGPAVRVFGRLAEGATVGSAQREMSVLGARLAAESPGTHARLDPRVLPYPVGTTGSMGAASLGLTAVNLLLGSLLLLVCGNVALLLFARVASRENELVVRGALGASPGRIMGQLFVEALVLATLAAAFGLAASHFALQWLYDVVALEVFDGEGVPFWYRPGLSPGAVLYAAFLTLLTAAVTGLLPGSRATRGLATRLRQAGPGGGGLRLGGVWTGLIVGQVALMALVPVFLFIVGGEAAQIRADDVGFPTGDYLVPNLVMDRELSPASPTAPPDTLLPARFRAGIQEVERRLEAEPGVRGVTFADRMPLMYHPARHVEIDPGPAGRVDLRRRVAAANVALDFFDVLRAPILAGRGFHSGDLSEGARVVVVNEAFVELVLGGNNPIGRRLRYVAVEGRDEPLENEPWYEIVGVVRSMGMARPYDSKRAGIYHPLAPGASYPVHMAVHFAGDAQALAARVRAAATEAAPVIQLHRVETLARVAAKELRVYAFAFWSILLFTGVVLLLSLAGIYSVLAFTVERRRREVGVRMALGGTSARVALGMFRRSMTQIGLGLLAGIVLAAALSSAGLPFVLMYGTAIFLVCSLATIVPVYRALRVQPAEALRADA